MIYEYDKSHYREIIEMSDDEMTDTHEVENFYIGGALWYNLKWDYRFLKLAKEISTWSKDPSTQVGCILVDYWTNKIVSTGYNGFPKRIADDGRLLDREEKYKYIIHAEMNAILQAGRSLGQSDGNTVVCYTYPFLPCSACAKHLIQSGISRVVSLSNQNPRWIEDINLGIKMFNEAKTFVSIYDWSNFNDGIYKSPMFA